MLTIETIQERTPRQCSLLAHRIELWWRDQRLRSLQIGDEGVETFFHRRVFCFPPIQMPAGYHFVTVRVYGVGWVSTNAKWKGRTIQVGIHADGVTKLEKRVPFYVW